MTRLLIRHESTKRRINHHDYSPDAGGDLTPSCYYYDEEEVGCCYCLTDTTTTTTAKTMPPKSQTERRIGIGMHGNIFRILRSGFLICFLMLFILGHILRSDSTDETIPGNTILEETTTTSGSKGTSSSGGGDIGIVLEQDKEAWRMKCLQGTPWYFGWSWLWPSVNKKHKTAELLFVTLLLCTSLFATLFIFFYCCYGPQSYYDSIDRIDTKRTSRRRRRRQSSTVSRNGDNNNNNNNNNKHHLLVVFPAALVVWFTCNWIFLLPLSYFNTLLTEVAKKK